MPKFEYNITCPNCSKIGVIEFLAPIEQESVAATCLECYFPLRFFPSSNTTEIRFVPIKKTAFLIHSSKPNERKDLDDFRSLMHLYGVSTKIIEEDPRSVDWLQKSLDGIKESDFVLVFLTKRCQFTDESGKIVGWKAPDKCYDEIAISFALKKDILALVEEGVDPGRVLETRAWCFRFSREPKLLIDITFFDRVDVYTGATKTE